MNTQYSAFKAFSVLKRYSELDPKTRAAFDESYARTGYAMKVPKTFVTQREVLSKFEGREVDKELAKRLRAAGFKCKFSGAEGGDVRCDDPVNYVDDMKRNQNMALKTKVEVALPLMQVLLVVSMMLL